MKLLALTMLLFSVSSLSAQACEVTSVYPNVVAATVKNKVVNEVFPYLNGTQTENPVGHYNEKLIYNSDNRNYSGFDYYASFSTDPSQNDRLLAKFPTGDTRMIIEGKKIFYWKLHQLIATGTDDCTQEDLAATSMLIDL